MSELINKVKTKYEIRGEVQVAKVYPELENLTVTPTKENQSFNHPDSYGYNNVVVKAIDCETLNVTPKKEQQAFDGMYDKVNVNAIDCETLNITPKQESQAFDGMYDKVRVNAIVGDTLNIKPTSTAQTFNGLYETVTVERVQGDTLGITPKEAEQSFNGLYSSVNVGAIETEEVTIDPDFSSQDEIEVAATEGKYIKKVTVNKDANLVAENILEGEVVCGIEGTGRNGTDTTDATATATDILKDKTAYVNGEKIVGTLTISTSTCNAVVSPIIAARSSSNAGLMDFITELHGYYKVNANAKLAFYKCTRLKYIEQLDTSATTNMQEMFSNCTSLTAIPQMNTSLVTSMQATFNKCSAITEFPLLDTSKVTTMYQMFNSCSALKTIPVLNTSSLNNSSTGGMTGTFTGCTSLSDESLNNILMMCINATGILTASQKTLSYIGLSSTQIAKCKTLSNYQAFVDAGWSAS